MRIFSLLVAVLVAASLYLMTFEREAVMRFAGAPATASQPAEDAPPEPAETAAPAGVSVVALPSEAREIDSSVILRGRSEALRSVEVAAETSGRIVSEPLRRGAFVEEGELLCRLDPGTREAALNEARARLAEARAAVPRAESDVTSAEAGLEEARINQNAASRLSQDGFASQTQVASSDASLEAARAGVEAASAGLESARAQIQSAEAAVASAETEMERLEIRAPFAGLLETDTAELGALMQPGASCATVIQLDPIKLVGFAPEDAVDRIAVGAPAAARLRSGREVSGEVTFLSRSADPETRTFRTEVRVNNADLEIRDGQTAEIAIAADGRMAHLLPQSALTLNDEGDLGVRLAEDGTARFAPVEMLRDTTRGVYVAGLPETAQVIVVGQDYVTDGVALDVTLREDGA